MVAKQKKRNKIRTRYSSAFRAERKNSIDTFLLWSSSNALLIQCIDDTSNSMESHCMNTFDIGMGPEKLLKTNIMGKLKTDLISRVTHFQHTEFLNSSGFRRNNSRPRFQNTGFFMKSVFMTSQEIVQEFYHNAVLIQKMILKTWSSQE